VASRSSYINQLMRDKNGFKAGLPGVSFYTQGPLLASGSLLKLCKALLANELSYLLERIIETFQASTCIDEDALLRRSG